MFKETIRHYKHHRFCNHNRFVAVTLAAPPELWWGLVVVTGTLFGWFVP